MNPSQQPKVTTRRLWEANERIHACGTRAVAWKKLQICLGTAILFRCGMTILKETRSLVLPDAEESDHVARSEGLLI